MLTRMQEFVYVCVCVFGGGGGDEILALNELSTRRSEKSVQVPPRAT